MSANIKTWQERVSDTTAVHCYPDAMREEIAELRAALALAQAPSAPVAPIDEREVFEAWFKSWTDPHVGGVEYNIKRHAAMMAWQARAALLVKAGATSMPDNWQWVPKQPTDEMRDAGNVHTLNRGMLFAAWKAMLAAAPTPPTTGEA